MTLPRRLTLKLVSGKPRLVSQPVKELHSLSKEVFSIEDKKLSENSLNKGFVNTDLNEVMLQFRTVTGNAGEIIIRLYNKNDEELKIGFRRQGKEMYIDRRNAGVDSFHVAFPKIHRAPMTQWPDSLNLEIYLDRSSVEMFVNGGERVITDRVFSRKPYSYLEIKTTSGEAELDQMKIFEMESVWRKEQLK